MEQMQQRQVGRSSRRRRQQAEQPQQPQLQTDHSSRERLAQLDAALDDYLTQTFTETAPIGLSQAHVRTQPLSNETLVRGFRQTIGE